VCGIARAAGATGRFGRRRAAPAFGDNRPAMDDAAESEPVERSGGLRERLAARLRGIAVHPLANPESPRAAVAIAVVDEGHGAELAGLPVPAQWSGRAALLLTRRSAALRKHAGQWALPGGRVDPGESPEQTALRELGEEVGLFVCVFQRSWTPVSG
jgi:hypothetical protein